MSKAVTESQSLVNQDNLYVIHIKEKLSPGWSEWFEGLTITYTVANETILCGTLQDQSALHGLLSRIRDLNLTLLSVRSLPSEQQSGEHLDKDFYNNPSEKSE